MQVIGHRGSRGLAPENTLASLKKALAHEVAAIEVDLRVTKDKVMVLHHNDKLEAPNGVKRRISTTSYKELLDLKPDLTTLEDALNRLGKKVSWRLEIKRREPIEPIVKILKQRLSAGWPKSSIVVGSSSQVILRQIKLSLPELGLIVIEPWSGVRANMR